MNDIYYCINENNNCPKKDTCKRYKSVGDGLSTTLYKEVCTENNNYILYIEESGEAAE